MYKQRDYNINWNIAITWLRYSVKVTTCCLLVDLLFCYLTHTPYYKLNCLMHSQPRCSFSIYSIDTLICFTTPDRPDPNLKKVVVISNVLFPAEIFCTKCYSQLVPYRHQTYWPLFLFLWQRSIYCPRVHEASCPWHRFFN